MDSLPAWWKFFWPPGFSQTNIFFAWPNSINSIDQKLQSIECAKPRSFQKQSIELKQILINPLICARDAHQLEIYTLVPLSSAK